MKKLLPLILMLAGAALLFTGCPKDAPEEPVSQPADTPDTPAFDGNVDLTKLAGYDEAAGGLVKDFGAAVSGYDEAFAFTLKDLGLEEGFKFTKIVVLGEVYDATGAKVDLASTWSSRLMLKLFASEADHTANTAIKEEFNCGVEGQSIAGFTAVTDILTIHAKADPVTKIVVTAIKFE